MVMVPTWISRLVMLILVMGPLTGADVSVACAHLDGLTFDVKFPVEKKAKIEQLSFGEGKIALTSLAQDRIPFAQKLRGNDKNQETLFSGSVTKPNGEMISIDGSVTATGEIRGSVTVQKPDHDAVARNFNGSLHHTKDKKKR